MDICEYSTQELMKLFHSLRESSPLLPKYANELRNRDAREMTCFYVPQRGKTRTQCTENATIYYGFCDRHSNTLFAKRVRVRFNRALEDFNEQSSQQEQINALLTDEAQREITPPPTRQATPPNTPEMVQESDDEHSEEYKKTYIHDDDEDDEGSPTPVEPLTSDEESSEEIRDHTSNPNTYEDDENVKLKVFPNEWGNFEHKQTGFLFDMASNHVYGVQHKNGKVVSLGKREQEFCKRHHWPFST